MAVPNTTTFSFIDVKDNVTGSPSNLITAFSIAEDSKFDNLYKGSKNSLLNFRNYGAAPARPSITLFFGGNSVSGCDTSTTRTVDVPVVKTFASTTILYVTGTDTLAPEGSYSNGDLVRYWDGSTFYSTFPCGTAYAWNLGYGLTPTNACLNSFGTKGKNGTGSSSNGVNITAEPYTFSITALTKLYTLTSTAVEPGGSRTYAPAGYYAYGGTARYWDGDGNFIGSPSSC